MIARYRRPGALWQYSERRTAFWITGIAIVCAACAASPGAAQVLTFEDWARADAETRRLLPPAFPDLSVDLQTELQRRGCVIPQTYAGRQPHNVIWGRFRDGLNLDLAVLCSRQGTSVILVFWGGKAGDTAEFAARRDRDFLQAVAPEEIGFSRAISAASPAFIQEQQRRHGGPLPPSVSHDGIEDAFIEKGSIVWYRHEGGWLQLTGTD